MSDVAASMYRSFCLIVAMTIASLSAGHAISAYTEIQHDKQTAEFCGKLAPYASVAELNDCLHGKAR